jgi:hypothetical protein
MINIVLMGRGFFIWGWMYKFAVGSCAGHRMFAVKLRFMFAGVLVGTLFVFETMAFSAISALFH